MYIKLSSKRYVCVGICRAVKNSETGLDVHVQNFKPHHGLLSTSYIYNILVVTNLSCFKNENMTSDDVVQFVVRHKFFKLKIVSSINNIFPHIFFFVAFSNRRKFCKAQWNTSEQISGSAASSSDIINVAVWRGKPESSSAAVRFVPEGSCSQQRSRLLSQRPRISRLATNNSAFKLNFSCIVLFVYHKYVYTYRVYFCMIFPGVHPIAAYNFYVRWKSSDGNVGASRA